MTTQRIDQGTLDYFKELYGSWLAGGYKTPGEIADLLANLYAQAGYTDPDSEVINWLGSLGYFTNSPSTLPIGARTWELAGQGGILPLEPDIRFPESAFTAEQYRKEQPTSDIWNQWAATSPQYQSLNKLGRSVLNTYAAPLEMSFEADPRRYAAVEGGQPEMTFAERLRSGLQPTPTEAYRGQLTDIARNMYTGQPLTYQQETMADYFKALSDQEQYEAWTDPWIATLPAAIRGATSQTSQNRYYREQAKAPEKSFWQLLLETQGRPLG